MRIIRSDASKLILYLISCFLLAALMTPWLYNAGTLLGEMTEDKSFNRIIDYVGEHARGAELPKYFKRCLLLAALLLLPPLIFALRLRNKPAPLSESPWAAYLPSHVVAPSGGQPLRNSRWGPLQLLTGFLLAGGLLSGTGWLLVSMEWFSLKDPVPWDLALQKAVGPAISASLLEEIVFRGVFLGICLRTFRPATAIILVSVLFSALHFLQPPSNIAVFIPGEPIPEGAVYIDPRNQFSGFQLLQAILMRFQDFELVLFEFISLTAIGLILAYARYATASLWLPIGLHSGWIFAYVSFKKISIRLHQADEISGYLVGSSLKEGLIPMATLALTAILVVLFVRIFPSRGITPTQKSLPTDD